MMKTLSNISAPASIIAFLIPYFSQGATSTNYFQFGCLLVFLLASAGIICLDIKNGPKRYKTEDGIKNYMLRWISHIGRIVVFTRDMSWALDPKVKVKLIEKAQAHELIICMPVRNEFAAELEENGAVVVEYSDINYEPLSRFTIIHYGRNDSRVAIGKTNNKHHVITEFQSGEHPLFYVALDLVNILIRQNENK
jgi:hypothetical protein